jgi:putative transposase
MEEGMMGCPFCHGDATQELERVTAWGYRLFRGRPCRRTFNERTGTPFTHLQVPTDIALLVVLWRLRYKLSLRDLAEMFLTRGFTFTHEAVWEWEERFAPLLTERLRAKRRGKAGLTWHADETYVKVDGCWCYLYRAIDADGNLVDSMFSETRDMDAAKRFFQRARTVVGDAPEKVTTDGHDAYPRAIRETLGSEVRHRTSRYMNNRMEMV